jgi:negative regulator of replication initiation
MHHIRLSEEVWQKIAEQGQFGETEDDVLRRVFKLPSVTAEERHQRRRGGGHRGRGNTRYATQRMSVRVEDKQLVISFEDGASNTWKVPHVRNKVAIRNMLENAMSFALENGATDPGQTNTVRKALTDAGYHLTK